MRWRRRRAADEATAAAPQLSVVPVPKVERALVALAVHAQQLDDRLDRLERRLDSTIDAAVDAPTHDDVLEVRVHSAKVAAELARVTVELRAEMEARITKLQPKPQPPTARERRIQTTAETILDLSDRLDTMPSDHYRDAATA
ncbi:MAG TPA: hypothetical protein VFK42_09520 [Acidimicrobiales bacterium]|jgi:hypothetical protein|nr:hypothetical protein [Acidimicrobiales bacterium]